MKFSLETKIVWSKDLKSVCVMSARTWENVVGGRPCCCWGTVSLTVSEAGSREFSLHTPPLWPFDFAPAKVEPPSTNHQTRGTRLISPQCMNFNWFHQNNSFVCKNLILISRLDIDRLRKKMRRWQKCFNLLETILTQYICLLNTYTIWQTQLTWSINDTYST